MTLATPQPMTPGAPLRRVLLAGGGSAGHVSPLLALADCLRRRDPQTAITALGTADGLEAHLVPARGYPLETLEKVAFPRRPNRAALRFAPAFAGAVRAAGQILDRLDPQVVVGFGGYVCPPAYLAARRRGLPIVIHEGNARAGLANRLGARITPYVATTFSATRLPHARLLGMPLRREITGADLPGLRDEARAHYGLREDVPTLLVTGGSLGAQRLNETFAASVAELREAGVQVVHLTGAGKGFTVPDVAITDGAATASPLPYVVREYAERMELAYAVADLVVCRAGANTVCELTALGLPAVYCPLPIGNGEQRFNIADVLAAGGGVDVPNEQLTPTWVREQLIPLVTDPARLSAMAAGAARVGQRDADEQLADLVLEAFADHDPQHSDHAPAPRRSRGLRRQRGEV